MSELLDNMSPTQPWAEPPLNPPLAPDADPIAAGEDSTARHEEAERVQSVEPYPPLHMLPPHQIPQDPLEPAFLEPEPAADYAVAVVQLLTPQEITDLSLVGQMQHEAMQQPAPAPFQAAPPQQGGLIGQYPPAQQPGPPVAYPQQQAPGFVGRPSSGPSLFRPPSRPQPGLTPQGPAIMRPLQVSSCQQQCNSLLPLYMKMKVVQKIKYNYLYFLSVPSFPISHLFYVTACLIHVLL